VAVDVIAYDALAVLVSYSYAQRQQGLPRSLGGDISLDQVRGLYAGEFFSWRDLGGVDLPVRLYAPTKASKPKPSFLHLLYLQADLQVPTTTTLQISPFCLRWKCCGR
jgi:ABC-type phosphate transport system substrate-binding protein